MAFEDNAEVQRLIRGFLNISAPHTDLLRALEPRNIVMGEDDPDSFLGHCRRLALLPREEKRYVAEQVEAATINTIKDDFGPEPYQVRRRVLLRRKGEILHDAFLRGETQNRNLLAEVEGLEEDKGRLAAITGMAHLTEISLVVDNILGPDAHPLLHTFSREMQHVIGENQLFLFEDPGTALLIFCDLLDQHLPLDLNPPGPQSNPHRSGPDEGGFSF